jgi:hypothetical protein
VQFQFGSVQCGCVGHVQSVTRSVTHQPDQPASHWAGSWELLLWPECAGQSSTIIGMLSSRDLHVEKLAIQVKIRAMSHSRDDLSARH